MINLSEVVEANRMLMALGGEDQMQRIAAASIERSLDLQKRIDRALEYATHTPPNSTHARQMARILDGSITLDDELNEVTERDRPMHLQLHQPAPAAAAAYAAPAPVVRKMRGPGKKKAAPVSRGASLTGRSPLQRKAFRKWAAEQGYQLSMQGPVPQDVIEAYDNAMEAERQARIEARRAGGGIEESGESREEQLPM